MLKGKGKVRKGRKGKDRKIKERKNEKERKRDKEERIQIKTKRTHSTAVMTATKSLVSPILSNAFSYTKNVNVSAPSNTYSNND